MPPLSLRVSLVSDKFGSKTHPSSMRDNLRDDKRYIDQLDVGCDLTEPISLRVPPWFRMNSALRSTPVCDDLRVNRRYSDQLKFGRGLTNRRSTINSGFYQPPVCQRQEHAAALRLLSCFTRRRNVGGL